MSKRDRHRRSWHGMNQPKPKLPHYLRTTKRLKSLDEFEAPPWKGRVKFGDDRVKVLSSVTWLNVFLIAIVLGGIFGWWLAQPDRCTTIGAFKIGLC